MRFWIPLFLLLPLAAQAGEITGTVRHVWSGDTIVLGKRVVRLQGIDAPESYQSYGPEAGRALRRRVSGERVRVITHERDAEGRLIGTVYHEGRNINRWLVRQGHAWADKASLTPESELLKWERRARQANRGLWAKPDPLPPWLWRREVHGGNPSGDSNRD